jgi:bifunctional DNase/RNase
VLLLDEGEPGRRLVLREADGGRELSFVIGAAEANALSMALQGVAVPRPLAYDLMGALLEAHGSRVARVAITRKEGEVYCATITLRRRRGACEVDARPSDAVNLAIRAGAPIYVAEHLLHSGETGGGPAQPPAEAESGGET